MKANPNRDQQIEINQNCKNQKHDHHIKKHVHSHNDQPKKKFFRCTKTLSLVLMFTLTVSFFLVELIVGYLTNSNSLLADAFHMLSDCLSLIIGLIAVRMSKKSVSSQHTYGWVRAEILGSLVNAVFLLALCFSIFIDSIKRYIDPEPLEKVDLMLIVGGVGLGINLIGLIIFGIQGHHGHSHAHSHSDKPKKSKKSKKQAKYDAENPQKDVNNNNEDEIEAAKAKNGNVSLTQTNENHGHSHKHSHKKSEMNMNIRGVFLHVLSDALGSVAVIVSGIIIKYGPPKDDLEAKWKLYIDPSLSLVITIFITISTVPLLKDACLVLLQTAPKHFDVEELKKHVRTVQGVLDVHHFHIWSLNAEKVIASAHLRVAKTQNNEDIDTMDEVKRLLHNHDIHSTTIQLEYDSGCDYNYDHCEGDDCFRKQCCAEQKNKHSHNLHL